METENSLIGDYMDFLDGGKTERECAAQIIAMAKKEGFKDLTQLDSVKPGDRVFIQKMNKAVALFTVGTDSLEKGMNILGAHIDSPRLDVKQNPLYEKDFVVYLNTHYYGGIKKYQWVTIPLALHGVVCKTDGTVVPVCVGEDASDPVFVISDILPHLAQKQMKESAADFIPGESLDLIVGSASPSKKDDDAKDTKKAILALLKQKYGFEEADFGSAEIEVVPAGKSRYCGFDKSLVLAYGQDDRSCAYTSVRAILKTPAAKRTACCLCVDKEEIGSVGATGMGSHFLENALAELVARLDGGYSDLTLRRCLAASDMLSSDVNAAFDPMNPDLFDKENASFLGGGIVFNKYTGARGKSGASDANPEFIARVRGALEKADVRYQMAELGRVDQGGGGTIAYLAAKYGMNVLDAGVAVLSMHAPWELTNVADLHYAYNAYKAFLTL